MISFSPVLNSAPAIQRTSKGRGDLGEETPSSTLMYFPAQPDELVVGDAQLVLREHLVRVRRFLEARRRLLARLGEIWSRAGHRGLQAYVSGAAARRAPPRRRPACQGGASTRAYGRPCEARQRPPRSLHGRQASRRSKGRSGLAVSLSGLRVQLGRARRRSSL